MLKQNGKEEEEYDEPQQRLVIPNMIRVANWFIKGKKLIFSVFHNAATSTTCAYVALDSIVTFSGLSMSKPRPKNLFFFTQQPLTLRRRRYVEGKDV
jgi:hypothetical protein